ncbi:regulatory protein cys-3 [Morchella snyderi]|nr:regulatory protein cys-3 [Morchella snyderi]
MPCSYTPGGRHIFDYLNVVRRDENTFDDFDPNDLAQYTEAKFFDFDMGQPSDDLDLDPKKENGDVAAATAVGEDMGLKMDFYADFDNFDFQGLTTGGVVEPLQHQQMQSAIPLSIPTPAAAVAAPPNPHSAASNASNAGTPYTPYSSASSPTPSTPRPAKRKASSEPDSLEEASRLAADEDKRRRNTAASARFRVKKKQREQALERTAKEMTDKCSLLEQRINRLELENRWLKGLIVEKNNAPGEDDPSVLFAAKYSSAAVTSTGECKDGVGTA